VNLLGPTEMLFVLIVIAGPVIGIVAVIIVATRNQRRAPLPPGHGGPAPWGPGPGPWDPGAVPPPFGAPPAPPPPPPPPPGGRWPGPNPEDP
jgi:hypothetical protein